MLQRGMKSNWCNAGVVGAFKGLGKGLESVVTRPLKGFGLAGYSVMESMHVKNPKCLRPSTK